MPRKRGESSFTLCGIRHTSCEELEPRSNETKISIIHLFSSLSNSLGDPNSHKQLDKLIITFSHVELEPLPKEPSCKLFGG